MITTTTTTTLQRWLLLNHCYGRYNHNYHVCQWKGQANNYCNCKATTVTTNNYQWQRTISIGRRDYERCSYSSIAAAATREATNLPLLAAAAITGHTIKQRQQQTTIKQRNVKAQQQQHDDGDSMDATYATITPCP
jgi:hypothetical protein